MELDAVTHAATSSALRNAAMLSHLTHRAVVEQELAALEAKLKAVAV